MTDIETERRHRIQVALWAYAYEVMNKSLVTDAVFDAACLAIDTSVSTGNDVMDKFFREEFTPDTGMWIYKHPELDGICKVYFGITGEPYILPDGKGDSFLPCNGIAHTIEDYFLYCDKNNTWSGINYLEYGKKRIKDCHYAVKGGIYERRELNNPKVWDDRATKFDFYYARIGDKIDIKDIISPHVMVSDYSTNLMDCLELARHNNMETIKIGPTDDMINQILVYTDNL